MANLPKEVGRCGRKCYPCPRTPVTHVPGPYRYWERGQERLARRLCHAPDPWTSRNRRRLRRAASAASVGRVRELNLLLVVDVEIRRVAPSRHQRMDNRFQSMKVDRLGDVVIKSGFSAAGNVVFHAEAT